MIEILEKYCQDGLLMKQTHPTYDLIIWNYTPKVQVERLWDSVARMSRGLVTDDKGKIIARPFSKFFNMSELTPEEIPSESFEVFDKVDGSLIILFYYKDRWIFASRGSFTSEQAIKAKDISKDMNLDELDIEYTYVFEIIY